MLLESQYPCNPVRQRNIAIFCDGTGSEVGASGETNVVKLHQCTVEDKKQISYYHQGVGTVSDFSFSLTRQFQLKLQRFSRMATGFGAEKVIEDAYRFLMHHYQPGDRLFLFGFSRGAFTVRAISGILGYIGLLRSGLDHLVCCAERIFFEQDKKTADKFGRMFARKVEVWFIGVWDTVESIGLPIRPLHKEIPTDPNLKPHVLNARHAVAID